MKRIIKRFIIIVLCICIALAMLSACYNSDNGSTKSSGSSSSSSSSKSYSYDPTAYYKIRYSSEAISAVKNDYFFESNIKWALGFRKNYSPEIGATSAKETTRYRYKKNGNTGKYEYCSEDCWEVTIKGNMSGYTDDYLKDFENYGFYLTAIVRSEDGEVSDFKVENMG